jgi:hypothetical protein
MGQTLLKLALKRSPSPCSVVVIPAHIQFRFESPIHAYDAHTIRLRSQKANFMFGRDLYFRIFVLFSRAPIEARADSPVPESRYGGRSMVIDTKSGFTYRGRSEPGWSVLVL